jgi:hypothetical protein
MKWVQLGAAIVWAGLAIPTALFWSKSVLWVGEMSVYACAGLHLGAFFSASANKRLAKQGDSNNKEEEKPC